MGTRNHCQDYYNIITEGESPEAKFKDLAPDICRQRMVVEGTLHNFFTPEDMKTYCKEISAVLNMTPVSEPQVDNAEEYGWCCFMHWKESGMHIYSWDHKDPKFFSIDIYTCKKFKALDVVTYTENFFKDNLIELAWKD
jgi:hypothetical protein